MNWIPARRWWYIAVPAPAVLGPLAFCNMQDSRPRTWQAAFLRGRIALIRRCRNTKQYRLKWRSRNGCARSPGKQKQQTPRLNRRLVVFLCVRNFFIAGRKLNIFHLFLLGLVVQLGAAFL